MQSNLIREQLLPYATKLRLRDLADIDLAVIHCTELPDLATARGYGERIVHPSGTGNSGHYYIDRDGRIYRYVADDRIAHHVHDYNERSIGIELVNSGRWPDWFHSRNQTMTEPYPEAQIDALLALLAQLRATLPNLRQIAGHEELDTGMIAASDVASVEIRRKLDPGRQFPWRRVMASCNLHSLEPLSRPV